MEITRNQYIRTDFKIEELRLLEINFEGKYDDSIKIEDMEIEDAESNVLIYKNEGTSGYELINIYRKIGIMITTYQTINRYVYLEIPETVEWIIMRNKLYNRTIESDMMIFMSIFLLKKLLPRKSEERFTKYIREEIIKNGRLLEVNRNNETIIYQSCLMSMDDITIEMIEILDRENKREVVDELLSKSNSNNMTALYYACFHKMERVAMELIPRMSEEAINKWDKDGRTALYWACYKKMERVAMELIPRMSEEPINKWDIKGYTALYWACFNDMEDVAIELIRRMSKKAINKWNNDGYTALYCACITKMERVRELINTINKK